MPLGESGLLVGRQGRHFRINNRKADGGVRAGFRLHRQIGNPRRICDKAVENCKIRIGTRNQRIETAERFRPFQRIEIVFHTEHGRRVDGFADEDAFDQLAALGHAENLRQRPSRLVAFQTFDSTRAEDQDAVCTLTAQNLLPGEGYDVEFRKIEALRESGRCCIAEGQALAVCRNEIAIRDARTGRGAVR